MSEPQEIKTYDVPFALDGAPVNRSVVLLEDHLECVSRRGAEIAALKAENEDLTIRLVNAIVEEENEVTELKQKLDHATKAAHALQDENLELLKENEKSQQKLTEAERKLEACKKQRNHIVAFYHRGMKIEKVIERMDAELSKGESK